MEQDTVLQDAAAAVTKMQMVKKRNTSSAGGSGSSKRSCMIKGAAATSTHTPAAVKTSKVQNARKRHTSSTSSTNSKRSCVGNATASTIARATPAVLHVPAAGSAELKLPPDMAWQKQAIATLQKYTSVPSVDRTSAPEPINSEKCSEILPHLLDKATGDGHCGFRALSKSITGTEANHAAFRAAVVAFMHCSCVGRRRPRLVSTRSTDDYIQEINMTPQDGCQMSNCNSLPRSCRLRFMSLQL